MSPSEADVHSRTALSKIPKFSPFSKIKSFISSAAGSNPLTRVKGHSGGEGVYELRVDPLDEKDLIRTPDREEFERSFRPPSSSPTGPDILFSQYIVDVNILKLRKIYIHTY